MKNSRDLILGEVVYISIIYRAQESRLLSLNGYDFIFDHRTGENREFLTNHPRLAEYFKSFINGIASQPIA